MRRSTRTRTLRPWGDHRVARRQMALALVALSPLALPLSSCADDANAQSPAVPTTTEATTTTTEPVPTRLDVVAREYDWSGVPDELPAGTYPMSFRNEGAEVHEVFVFRNTHGLSLEELAPLGPVGILDQVELAGKAIAVPGQAAGETTLTLTPGEYQVVCFVPTPDGLSHFGHGMQQTLTVS